MGSSETLRSVIDAGRTAKRLDELSTARVIGKIAELVHAAQQKAGPGKAIGPITPAGITIEASGAVKLGLAEPTAFGYSAPEQINGADGDRRSDVFSLGAVMWEALTHEPLFEGSDAAVRIAVANAAIGTPGEVNANIPAELSAICMKALARSPADRYQSTKVMAAEIEAVLDDAGYADNDDKIAEYIATLGLPRVDRKVTLSPPLVSTATPAQGVGVSPVHVEPAKPADLDKTVEQPTISDEPSQPISRVPSILDKPPTPPPASMSAPSAGSLSAPASISAPSPGSLSPTSFLKPATVPPNVSAKATLLGSGPNLAAALANAGTTPAEPKLPAATSSPTTHGFASGAVLSEAAKLDALPAPVVPAKPVLPAPRTPSSSAAPNIANAATVATPTLASTNPKPPATIVDTPPPMQKLAQPPGEAPKLDAKLIDTPTPRKDLTPAKVDAGRKRPPTNNPHPASVVSLPSARGGKTGRESQEVLGGWGWGTDSHPAIGAYEDGDDLPVGSNRKPLLYAIGGGLTLALIITVIAFAFGGSTSAKATSPSAATKEGVDPTGSAAVAKTMGSDIEYGSNSAGSNAVVAIGSAAGSDVAGSAAAPAGSATAGSADVAAQEAAAKQAAADEAVKQAAAEADAKKQAAADAEAAKKQAAADADAKKQADAEAKKQAAADADAAKKQAAADAASKKDAARQEAAQKEAARKEAAVAAAAAKKERDAAARAEAAKKAAAAPKRPTEHKDPKTTVAKTEPKPDAKEVETAYRQGLQQFARGDTTGALASLRTSLAGNPNYAPTWRGLGLVFEKMGERDQARSAFKRYLQLAPNAGDADKIRDRLEKLGS